MVIINKSLIIIVYTEINNMIMGMHIQSLAIKLAVSISVIRKLAVVFIPVEIQKFV